MSLGQHHHHHILLIQRENMSGAGADCAFYPGAGTDVIPPTLCRAIKTWIYLDSQPRSENGDKPGFARPRFIPKLLTVMTQNGFMLQTVEADVLTFYHPEHGQTIRYETNAVFPEALQPRHRCDTLVLCGYELTRPPPDFLASYAHIITDSKTYYTASEEAVFLTKHVSTILYDTDWDYWEPSCLTPSHIQRHAVLK